MTSMPRAFAAAISAWLVEPQSTVTMTVAPARSAASRAASDRPWPSSRRLGTYGSTASPYRAQGEDQDRQPGQPVGIEVAEDQDPLAARRGRGARRSAGAVRCRAASMGSWRPSSGSANQASRSAPSATPRLARTPGEPLGQPVRRGGSGRVGRRRGRRRERSSGSGVRPRPSGCHASLHRGFTGHRRAAGQETDRRARGARVRLRCGRAGGPPRGASRRAAGWRRRSTSRSPR